MTRMLWVSNGRMWKTGYGNQTDLFLPRLKKAGYDPVLFSFTDRMGAPIEDADGILHVHPRYDAWGNDVYEAHMAWTKAQFSFGLFDFYATVPTEYAKHPHAHWAPVDGEPLRTDLADSLRTGARWVIAMTRFGERVLKEAGFDPLYCPHGIDGKVFRPVDRAAARLRMQKTIDDDVKERGHRVELGDKFVVLINSANNDNRKGFFEGLSAFAQFHEKHPNSVLYLHTNMPGPRGDNLFDFIRMLEIPPEAVVYPNQYYYDMGMIDGEWMNDLYNTADVLLQPTYGEGFGIPILEAQFAGCPVIATDCSTIPELVKTGIRVPGVKFAKRAGVYWVRPLIEPLTQALEKAHLIWSMHELDRQSVSDLVQEYEIDKVFADHMLPVIRRIEEDLKRQEPVTVPARGGHVHRWSPTGLYIGGKLWTPCLEPGCATGRNIEGNYIQTDMFPSTVGDVALDIEDDPESGVAKVVMRELVDTYQLADVDLKPGDTVLDIGAHVGIVSIYLAKRFPGIRVIAIEPSTENFNRLQRNIAANGVKVEAVHAAVTSDGRIVTMPVAANGNSGGRNIYWSGPSEPVESYSLKNLYEEFGCGCPALIKMDCEGAEYEILEGHEDLLQGVRYFTGEFHTNNQFPWKRMVELRTAIERRVENVFVGVTTIGDLPAVQHNPYIPADFVKRVDEALVSAEPARPDVSVLMPVYNGLTNYPPGELQRVIWKSLLQSGVKVELCATDDCSTDGSHAALEEHAKAVANNPNYRIRVARHETNQGVAAALNTAVQMATGRYIIVQSVRSWYESGAFKALVEALDGNPDIGFAYGNTQYSGAQNHVHTPPPFQRERFFNNFDSLFGYMYRREALDAGCRYANFIEREGKHIDVSDYDFIMQLIVKMGWKGLALRDRLILHYVYSGQGQMTNLVHKYQGEIMAIFHQKWGEAA